MIRDYYQLLLLSQPLLFPSLIVFLVPFAAPFSSRAGSGNKYTENLGLIVSNQAAHIGDVEKYWEDKLASRYLVGSVGCPAPCTPFCCPLCYSNCAVAKYCNPDECCGLCQCGECKSPTACEENEDYCQVNDFFGFRCCQTVLPVLIMHSLIIC